MKKALPLVTAFSLLALMGAGCMPTKTDSDVAMDVSVGSSGSDTDTGVEVDEGAEVEANVETVILREQNDSNESGTMTLTEKDGETTVVLTIVGQPAGVAQPAHIHVGTCAEISAVVYPLSLVVNGRSETTFELPISQMLASAAELAVNVHKSELDLDTHVACGDIDV